MADPKPSAPTEHDYTHGPDDAGLIFTALCVAATQAHQLTLDYQKEIDSPTNYMNPQPALWAGRLEEATLTRDAYVRLANEYGQNVAAEPFVIVIETKGVEGPAEHNRPAGANSGPSST